MKIPKNKKEKQKQHNNKTKRQFLDTNLVDVEDHIANWIEVDARNIARAIGVHISDVAAVICRQIERRERRTKC
jgi:hypothetical protein